MYMHIAKMREGIDGPMWYSSVSLNVQEAGKLSFHDVFSLFLFILLSCFCLFWLVYIILTLGPSLVYVFTQRVLMSLWFLDFLS